MNTRIIDALLSVKTEIVALCANDDFVGFNALTKASDFLTSNHEYSAVMGWGPTYSYDGRTLGWNFPDFETEKFNITNSDPLERILKIFSPYQQMFWSVSRRDVLIDTYQSIPDVSSHLFQEINHTVIVALCGHARNLPLLYNARDRTPGVSIVDTNRTSFDEWTKDSTTWQELENWKDAVCKIALERSITTSTEQIRKTLDKILQICAAADKSIKPLPPSLRQQLHEFISRAVPKKLKQRRWSRSLAQARIADYPLAKDHPNHAGDTSSWDNAREDWSRIRDSILSHEPAN